MTYENNTGKVKLFGTSMSRCLRDIVDGIVDQEDVVMIACGTKVDLSPPEIDRSIEVLTYHYGANYWHGLTEEQSQSLDSLIRDFAHQGKFYQPRLAGNYPLFSSSSPNWYYLLPRIEGDQPPSIINAVQDLLMISQLTNTDLPREYHGLQ